MTSRAQRRARRDAARRGVTRDRARGGAPRRPRARPLRRAGAPPVRGALPPPRAPHRRRRLSRGRLDDARPVRRALGVRPPPRAGRRRGPPGLVRVGRPDRHVVRARLPARPARPPLRALPRARRRRRGALARDEPVADRVRLDVRDLRGQDRRRLLRRRRAPRRDLRARAARRDRSRPGGLPPSGDRRLGGPDRWARAARRAPDPPRRAALGAGGRAPRRARGARHRHHDRSELHRPAALRGAPRDPPARRSVLRRRAASHRPGGGPRRSVDPDAGRERRLVPALGTDRGGAIPHRLPADRDDDGAARLRGARAPRLVGPAAAAAASRPPRRAVVLLLRSGAAGENAARGRDAGSTMVATALRRAPRRRCVPRRVRDLAPARRAADGRADGEGVDRARRRGGRVRVAARPHPDDDPVRGARRPPGRVHARRTPDRRELAGDPLRRARTVEAARRCARRRSAGVRPDADRAPGAAGRLRPAPDRTDRRDRPAPSRRLHRRDPRGTTCPSSIEPGRCASIGPPERPLRRLRRP